MKRSMMTKKRLEEYTKLRSEIEMLEGQILNAGLEAESDTVMASSKTMPYGKHVVAVKGYSTRRKFRLIARKARLEAECDAVEQFVESVEDSMMRQILTQCYLENNIIEAAAMIIGCSKSQIEKKLKAFFEDIT